MIGFGTRLLGRRYHLIGQGLMGGGIATLYFSVFAAANFHHLTGMTSAFGVMIGITVLAGWLSDSIRNWSLFWGLLVATALR